jgi:hypothetical protein
LVAGGGEFAWRSSFAKTKNDSNAPKKRSRDLLGSQFIKNPFKKINSN